METDCVEWRPVYGFEGLYEVSSSGRVRSVDRIAADGLRRLKGVELSRIKTGKYYGVSLYKDNTRSQKLIHHLVLEAFVGPRPEGLFGLHYDDNPENNALGNLRWGTKSENGYDAVRNARHHASQKTHCKRGHPLATPNLVKSEIEKGKRSCLACARALGVLHSRGRTFSQDDLKRVADSKYALISVGA
ncbi:NUMOD4 motif-containing HNH endonuclease [uncultured Corynebacterium sp.]|uniref:NUMOD4 motif-containing HNH endonuclease n=1 Tax=uncultured Corynebacterium sp. TaxID=159447 RepID=UPI00338F3971